MKNQTENKVDTGLTNEERVILYAFFDKLRKGEIKTNEEAEQELYRVANEQTEVDPA